MIFVSFFHVDCKISNSDIIIKFIIIRPCVNSCSGKFHFSPVFIIKMLGKGDKVKMSKKCPKNVQKIVGAKNFSNSN